MPCKIEIKQNITNKVSTDTDSGFNLSIEGAQAVAKKVNQSYGIPVVSFSLNGDFIDRNIRIPDSLVDVYYNHELSLEQQEFTKAIVVTKPGVEELFNSNPELASIGTPEQYSQYLDSIFPDSEVKDIVYHGSPIKGLQEIKRGDDNQGKMYTSRYGITFTDNDLSASIYAGQISTNPNIEDNFDNGQVYPALLNLKNFIIQDFNNESYGGKFGSAISIYNNAIEKAKEDNKDGFIAKNIADPSQNQTNYVVFEPEQIHILGNEKDIKGFKNFVAKPGEQLTFFQKEGVQSSPASPQLIKLMKEFIKAIGVDYKPVSNIVVNGVKYDGNGVALIMQKLIQVVEGKEDVALPEEAMHFAVEIIRQTNPKLYQTLLKEINNHPKLNEVIALYGNDPNYQKDGRRNIVMLKEEAIAQVMANRLEDIVGRNWFDRVIEGLKSLFYTRSGFDKASMAVLSGKIASVEDIDVSQRGAYFQLSEGERVFNDLLDTSNRIGTVPNGVDADGKPKTTYELDGIKAVKRVSDFAKEFYERIFPQIGKSEFEEAVFGLKAEKGTTTIEGDKELLRYVDISGYFFKKEPLSLI